MKLRFTRITEQTVSHYNQNSSVILIIVTFVAKKLRLISGQTFFTYPTRRVRLTGNARISYKMFLIVKL